MSVVCLPSPFIGAKKKRISQQEKRHIPVQHEPWSKLSNIVCLSHSRWYETRVCVCVCVCVSTKVTRHVQGNVSDTRGGLPTRLLALLQMPPQGRVQHAHPLISSSLHPNNIDTPKASQFIGEPRLVLLPRLGVTLFVSLSFASLEAIARTSLATCKLPNSLHLRTARQRSKNLSRQATSLAITACARLAIPAAKASATSRDLRQPG